METYWSGESLRFGPIKVMIDLFRRGVIENYDDWARYYYLLGVIRLGTGHTRDA